MASLTGAAILAINPSAVVHIENVGTEDEVINWLEGTAEISAEDIETKRQELIAANAAAEEQEATDKANGNQKLLDLGLTQAEATALTGYTPPSE